MKALLLILIISLMPINSFALPSSVICDMKKYSILEGTPGKFESEDGTYKVGAKGRQIIIGALNSKNPVLTANQGSSKLLKIRELRSSVWMIESPGQSIIVYTYFPLSKTLMSTKQYDIFGKPFGMIQIGGCSEIK